VSAAEVIVPFVIVQAYVVAPAGPEAVLPGEAVQTLAVGVVIVGVAGFALIVAEALFVALHPEAFVTTSVRFTLPDAPAVQVTVWMFVADVIVPPVIDQAYVVAPAGPEAVFPVEFAQTPPAGIPVIVGVAGEGLIVAEALFVAEQPDAFVTTSVRFTLPEEPAVQVTVWRFVAEVMVPPVIVQAYVAAPAGPVAVFPVESAQTPPAGIPVIVGVAGFGRIVAVALFVALHPDALVTTSVRFTLPDEPAV